MDLTTLSDDEAKHIWEVIQRDFNLRKIEEERLGELKSKIEKEDTKTELLGTQTTLVESHCIRCLQPFKFLVNSKRQCIDCKLYTCKACSRYNKKEHGWVCDPCRMTRVLKIGTVGWYHDNVRTRFKRFGSAKVMKSLYKRLNGEGGRRDSDTQSMPDFRNDTRYNGHDEDYAEAEAQRHKVMRKNKRLLSVHPMDLDVDIEEYFPTNSHPHSRRQSFQTQEERGGGHIEYMDMQQQHRMNRRRSLDRYNTRADDGHYGMVHSRSMSKISSSVNRQHYVDTSEEEETGRYPMYQPPNRRRPSYGRGGSHENLQAPPQPPINELNKRMSAIESLLNRLESKITVPDDEPASPTAAQIEEEKLRRKLSELAGNISVPSSDEEAGGGKKTPVFNRAAPRTNPPVLPPEPLSSSSDEGPTEAQRRSTAAALCDITKEFLRTINATESAMSEYSPTAQSIDRPMIIDKAEVRQADEAYRELEENVYMTSGKSFDLEKKLRHLEHSAKNRFAGATDSDLSELEDVVTLTAQRVQSTESEVSDLESKLAALNASGKKKISGSQNRRRFNQDITTKTSNGSGSVRKSNHVKN
ncbi:melanophilin a isoform X2 [Esox lucius]|uniref:RabBD domain-containing protein n=2 Tax=Esox lucius TaxID=8010 RepID=A0A3P8X9X3_ESOLU|nr:melanophilin a isoform X2 [Esox lucius]XP_019898118.2 melanophilin a isoform X2 [Esox lucius]